MIFNLASLILKFDLMLLNGVFGSIIRKCYVATQHLRTAVQKLATEVA